MPLMNTDSVISSENPKELSAFYAKINSGKACKGFNKSHYFISLRNRSKINFFLPNENHQWQREGNSTSFCFQHEPCANPSKIFECLTSKLMNIGGDSVGLSKSAKFGPVQWMFDPVGDQFLILSPYLTNGSAMKALI